MRKRLMVFLACLISGSMLVGCSGNVATEGEPEAAVTNNANEQTTVSKTVSLTVWGAEEDAPLLTQIIENFKQEHANEASFDITLAEESESTCKDTLLGDVQNSADVFAFVDDQLMTLVAAGALEKVADADKIKGESSEGAVEASSVNGTLYAYPMTADNGYFMYYNKEYFSEEDLTSLDRMLEVAAENEKKVVMDWSSGWYLYSFFGNTGLEVGLNDDGISNYCTWNSTEGSVTGTDVAESMMQIAASPGFLSANDDEFLAGVGDTSIIAGVSGVWNASALEEAWGSNFGAVKLPAFTCAEQEIQMASFAGYKMIGVNAYSKNTEWALKLAQWITNEENQTLRFTMRGQGPSNNNAADSPEVQASHAIQALIAQSEFASLQRIGGNYWSPVQSFGEAMLTGNDTGKNLQEVLDLMVEQVTASNTN